MSLILNYGRPFVQFDPTIKDHRKWFLDFEKHNTWGKCPVRFLLDEDYADIITMIRTKLNQFYLTKEFNN